MPAAAVGSLVFAAVSLSLGAIRRYNDETFEFVLLLGLANLWPFVDAQE